MFDLITGKTRHLPSHSALPIVCSTTAQAAAATAFLVTPALFVAEQIPPIPTMLAFVAPVPTRPAPAPPPAQRPEPVTRVTPPQPSSATSETLAPVEAKNTTEAQAEADGPAAVNDAVPGGVEGGVPAGIVGGIVGGVPEPPPAPPPPPATGEPVRIAGQIQPPMLVHRVEPVYPPAAAIARLQGIVLLEALVDRDGSVAELKVLRSAGSLLDREALIAVRQWRYEPLILNGHRERFVLTVVVAFSVAGGV